MANDARSLTTVGEIVMVDAVTVMLSASTTVACRMRLAAPTPLRSAVVDEDARFPDSVGRALDAFDYAVARAVCAAGSAAAPMARLAAGVEVASALPSAHAVARSGRALQTLLRHARPLHHLPARLKSRCPPARKARTESVPTRCFVLPADDCAHPVTRAGHPVAFTLLPGADGDGEVFDSFEDEHPDSVTALDLSYCSSLATSSGGFCAQRDELRHVELPSGVTSLGAWFAQQSGLTSLDLAHCTALRKLGAGAFSHCKALRTVKLPPNLDSLCDGVASCSGLTQLDASQCHHLSQIGGDVLSGCTALRSLALPASVTSIGSNFCMHAEQLQSLDLSHCAGLTAVGDFFLVDCSGLRCLKLPAALARAGALFCSGTGLEELDLSHTSLTELPNMSLSGCASLQSLRLPATLVRVGEGTVKDTPDLEELDLSHCADLAPTAVRWSLGVLACEVKLPLHLAHRT